MDVTPQYFQVALGTTQAFDASTPPQLVQNMRQMGFHHCPRVAAAIYPVHVHRDVLCLLPRNHGPEHVYLWMVFMGLLRHLDPTATRLHSLVLCSSIPARPCFLCLLFKHYVWHSASQMTVVHKHCRTKLGEQT